MSDSKVKGLLTIFSETKLSEKNKKTALFFIAFLSVVIYLVLGLVIFYSDASLTSKSLGLTALVLVLQGQGYGMVNTWLFIPVVIFMTSVGFGMFPMPLWFILAIIAILFILLMDKKVEEG